MTLNQLFTEIQYGKEYMKNKTLTEAIKKCYDEEYDTFSASKRAKQVSNVVWTEGEELKLNRILSKITVLEDRVDNGKPMSEAYRKMQTASIADDCNLFTEEVLKFKRVDSRKLESAARIIGDVKYYMTNYVDDKAAIKESNNPLFNKFIREEISDIEKVIKN
jgi:hypothetical protein